MAKVTKKATTKKVVASKDKALEYAELVFKAPVNDYREVLYVIESAKDIKGVWSKSTAIGAKQLTDPTPKVYEVTKKDGELLKVEI
jgi:hypothetical protein